MPLNDEAERQLDKYIAKQLNVKHAEGRSIMNIRRSEIIFFVVIVVWIFGAIWLLMTGGIIVLMMLFMPFFLLCVIVGFIADFVIEQIQLLTMSKEERKKYRQSEKSYCPDNRYYTDIDSSETWEEEEA